MLLNVIKVLHVVMLGKSIMFWSEQSPYAAIGVLGLLFFLLSGSWFSLRSVFPMVLSNFFDLER